ncbi:MAG: hypothetical protein WCK03_03725 [Candidatus Taylorbacteria bacterium]
MRKDKEQPLATGQWGWKYHHIGIPTKKIINNEKYLAEFKIAVAGFEESPYGIEWMRFEKGSQVPELIKTIPHIAFEVDNIDIELTKHKFNIITETNSPSDGVRVVMIEHNGAPIELIEFSKGLKE